MRSIFLILLLGSSLFATSLQIEPEHTYIRKGEGFDVAILLEDVNDLGGVSLKLLFDKKSLRAETVTVGSLLNNTNDIFLEQIENEEGWVSINAGKWEPGNGTGTIGSISFTCLATNPEGSLTLSEVRLITYSTPTTDIEVTIRPGYVHPYPLEYFKITAPSTFTAGLPSSINITAFDKYGTVACGYNGTITLTVDNGTVSPASIRLAEGSLTAGITLTKSGTTTITARDSATPQTGTATTYVTRGSASALFIQPASATLTSDDSLAFITFAGDNSGNTWTVASTFTENDPIGTMSANIYYPGKVGTWAITATYNSLSATATVNVTYGSAVTLFIQPASATITTDDSLAFSAFTSDNDGNTQTVTGSATFTANEGTMSTNTYYPGKIGTWTITATYTTFMAQATITVFGKLYSFGIGAIGNQIVGIAFPITISALTKQGDPAYTLISLTDRSGTIHPTLMLVNGTYTGYVTIGSQGTTSITVSSGTISATSNPFFVENLFLPKGLDDIRVWPNPYRSDKSSDPFIVFELPDGCHLSIYTISGRLIREFEKTLGRTKWMLDNQDGKPVSSGMYIYLIEQAGRKVTGEIGVIR
ncbi:MAG: hypothetical protein QME07_02105 [bacterium]|nr:hypothetical protein [bacterium]